MSAACQSSRALQRTRRVSDSRAVCPQVTETDTAAVASRRAGCKKAPSPCSHKACAYPEIESRPPPALFCIFRSPPAGKPTRPRNGNGEPRAARELTVPPIHERKLEPIRDCDLACPAFRDRGNRGKEHQRLTGCQHRGPEQGAPVPRPIGNRGAPFHSSK
jgi:hypothetical protein